MYGLHLLFLQNHKIPMLDHWFTCLLTHIVTRSNSYRVHRPIKRRVISGKVLIIIVSIVGLAEWHIMGKHWLSTVWLYGI